MTTPTIEALARQAHDSRKRLRRRGKTVPRLSWEEETEAVRDYWRNEAELMLDARSTSTRC